MDARDYLALLGYPGHSNYIPTVAYTESLLVTGKH